VGRGENRMSAQTNPQLTEISVKLDKVAKLLALNIVKDLKHQKAQIGLLSDSGFQPKEIADLLSTSSNSVRVTLHTIRKEREKKDYESDQDETLGKSNESVNNE
jgi:hypothetical protein